MAAGSILSPKCGCATNSTRPAAELGAEAMARREARWREFEAAAAGDVRVGARGLTQTGEIQVRVRPEARRIFELRVFSSRFDEVY